MKIFLKEITCGGNLAALHTSGRRINSRALDKIGIRDVKEHSRNVRCCGSTCREQVTPEKHCHLCCLIEELRFLGERVIPAATCIYIHLQNKNGVDQSRERIILSFRSANAPPTLELSTDDAPHPQTKKTAMAMHFYCNARGCANFRSGLRNLPALPTSLDRFSGHSGACPEKKSKFSARGENGACGKIVASRLLNFHSCRKRKKQSSARHATDVAGVFRLLVSPKDLPARCAPSPCTQRRRGENPPRKTSVYKREETTSARSRAKVGGTRGKRSWSSPTPIPFARYRTQILSRLAAHMRRPPATAPAAPRPRPHISKKAKEAHSRCRRGCGCHRPAPQAP